MPAARTRGPTPFTPARTRGRLRRRLRPCSVIGLVLFGFLLVGGLPIAGLLVSGAQITRLTRESEQLLENAVVVTRAARETVDRALSLERAARQYLVLRDPSARAGLVEQRRALEDQADAMARLGLGPETGAVLDRIVALSGSLSLRALSDPGSEPWPPALATGFREFNGLGRELTEQANQAAEDAIGRLRSLGNRSRDVIHAQIAVAVPIALGLAVVFVALITRPIRDLDRGIRALANPASARIPRASGPRDLRALSVRLEWVRRKLLRGERDRQRLLAQVSHELKTPLSSIREGVSLLEDELLGPLDRRQTEVVAILHQSVERLQQQIETLLRYNRLRARPRLPQLRPVALDALVAEVLAAHRLAVSARGLELQTDLVADARVLGDRDMLRTALDNLISNAVKYAAPGGRLGVFARRRGPCVVVEVADNGAGIDPSERKRVFEPFYRGHRDRHGHQPGSGLGLTICRDLVRGHGGEVRLIDRPGWRTVFEITLPSAHPQETAA